MAPVTGPNIVVIAAHLFWYTIFSPDLIMMLALVACKCPLKLYQSPQDASSTGQESGEKTSASAPSSNVIRHRICIVTRGGINDEI